MSGHQPPRFLEGTDSGYLCNKAGLVVGRKTRYPGQPYPACALTPLLLSNGYVRQATSGEWAAAVAEYGYPPEEIPTSGEWEYEFPSARKARKGGGSP